MKVRATSMLSLIAVLITGSAAAFVNAEVLKNDAVGRPSALSSVASASSVSVTVPDNSVTTTTLTGAPIVHSTTAVYQVGAAGVVTLDIRDDVLVVVAAVPNPGWELIAVTSDGPLKIEATFASAGTVLKFRANLLFGVVGTSTEVEGSDNGSVSDTTIRGTTAPTSGAASGLVTIVPGVGSTVATAATTEPQRVSVVTVAAPTTTASPTVGSTRSSTPRPVTTDDDDSGSVTHPPDSDDDADDDD